MTEEQDRPTTEALDEGSDPGSVPPVPAGWNDPLTGVDGPRLWDRVVSSEVARIRRYGRTSTVALVEIRGLDEFAEGWGVDAAERMFLRLARTLAVEIRSSDHIARIDRTRFAILLTETDEVAAINFVERARAACERQLGAVRIGFGWASPTGATDLRAAIEMAERRLASELGPTT